MSTAVKRILSGSTDGKGIKLIQTSSGSSPSPETIHTAVAGTTPGSYDEIWLWAQNNHTADVVLTLEFGGVAAPDDNIIVTIPYKAGLVPVLPGFLLQNAKAVRAFASVANVVSLFGFVNRITD